jgi:hypothetical protein
MRMKPSGRKLPCVLLLCGGVGLVVLLGFVLALGFNPMRLAFLVSFEVKNASNEDVTIMPIGTLEGSEKYSPLPRYRNSYPPAISLDTRTPVAIPGGETVTITYDYDDINFRHILVRDAQGTMYTLNTDKRGNRHSCYGPQKSCYSIPPLKNLELASNDLIPCFYGKSVDCSRAEQSFDE